MSPGGDAENVLATLLDESVDDLYEHAPVAYLSSLTSGTIVKVNATLAEWLRRPRSEIVGALRLHDLLTPGARIYYETHYAPLLHMQGSVREIAVELVRADGSRLPVLMSSTLVAAGDGDTRIIRTTFVDASERRRYERELLRARADAEARARSAVALGHVSEGVILVDPSGRIELLNPAAERILAVTAADVVGRQAHATIEGWRAVSEGVPASSGPGPTHERVLPVQRGGVEQWLAVAAVDAGDGVVYTLRDVTTERRLDHMRDDLVAIVSHELRTPLTGVYGAATTLLGRHDDLDADTRTLLLEMVVSEAARLAAIVDQILLTSRLDAGQIVDDRASFAVADALIGLGNALSGTDRLIVDVRDDVLVRGDLEHLRQAASNLVDNALKYSSGLVRVRAEPRDLSVRITVSDEGPGIPPTEHQRVFEKFYRLDPDQQSGVGGTGLGLYIAREFVERMGGRIGLQQGTGGATFYIDIPRA
jgi:PAS domain S-box-containing protein